MRNGDREQAEVTLAHRPEAADPDEMLSPAAMAALIGVTPRTLQNWRDQGRAWPPYQRFSSRCIRYGPRSALRQVTGKGSAHAS